MLPFLNSLFCFRCRKPFNQLTLTGPSRFLCNECIINWRSITQIHTLVRSNTEWVSHLPLLGDWKNFIQRWKRLQSFELTQEICKELECPKSWQSTNYHSIILLPLPSRPKLYSPFSMPTKSNQLPNYLSHSVNHAWFSGKANVLDIIQYPFQFQNPYIKLPAHVSQKSKTQEERLLNTGELNIELNEELVKSLNQFSSLLFILVDDISTTGATLLSAKRALTTKLMPLLETQAKLTIWTLARTPGAHTPWTQTPGLRTPTTRTHAEI